MNQTIPRPRQSGLPGVRQPSNRPLAQLIQAQAATNSIAIGRLHAGLVKPGEGLLSRGGLKGTDEQTTLAATTLGGGSISIQATGKPGLNPDGSANPNAPSGIQLAGVKLSTPAQLRLDAGEGKLAFNLIQTTQSTSQESRQRDLTYQKAKGQGATSTQAEYNELSYGALVLSSPTVVVQHAQSAGTAGALTPASLSELSAKPGMGWLNDVQRQQAALAQTAQTNPAAALHIERVQLAHEQWDYKSQGLTQEGAVIVAVVVAYFTAGAGSSLVSAAAGTAGGDGCAPGAIGAALGEISAEAYGRKSDTVEFAAMISGIGAALAGGDASQISLASQAGANAAANNRMLHPTEIQRIKELAGKDAQKEARLTAAACAMARCYAEYPEGTAAYNQFKTLADAGASDSFASERELLKSQAGLFTYSTTGLFSDTNVDAAKQFNNTYQIGTRALGTLQAGAGTLGVLGSAGLCTTGVGCAAGAVTGTVSADYAQAGARQAFTGNATQPYAEQVLQTLGLSPQAAAYTYAALGMAPAAVEGLVLRKAVNAEAAANAAAKFSYEPIQKFGGKWGNGGQAAIWKYVSRARP